MIIICTNSGRLRAFQVSQSDTTTEELNQIREIADEEFDFGPQRISEITSDQAGRFQRDSRPGIMRGESHRLESHGLEVEEERRLISHLAERVGQLVQAEGADWWQLAAPKAINSRLVEKLDPAVRERLTGNEKHDLTKLPTLEVGRRFGLIK
jgi:hypothetical protein